MLNKFINDLKIPSVSPANVSGSNNPFEREGVALFDFPIWVGYTFGALFVVIGLMILPIYYYKTGPRSKQYKVEQLKKYNEKYRKKETDYKRTGMYLPATEIAKKSWPLIIGVLFIFIGIAWMAGNSLTTL